MLDVQFRACRYDDLEDVQILVDDLFSTYPAEKGIRPNINRTFSEFSRFP